MKIFVKYFIFSFIAAALLFIGKNDYILSKIADSESDIHWYQTISFGIGLFISALLFPFNYSKLKNIYLKQNEKYNNLTSEFKNMFLENLKIILKHHNTKFNIRIFEPEKGVKGIINKYFNNKTILSLKENEGFTDKFPYDSLYFEVSNSTVQGIVGKSYKERALFIDYNVNNNTYDLTPAHKSKIGKIQFGAAIPIFDKLEKKIIKIVTLDSNKKLDLNDTQKSELENQMKFLAAFVDRYI